MADEDDIPEIDEEEGQKTETEQTDDESQSPVEIEARKHGWVPEDEWDDSRQGSRKPKEFVSAEDFMERVTGQLPILRERLRNNDKVIDDLKGKITEMHELFKYQADNQKKAREREYQRGLDEAKKRMRQAVADADQDEYDAAEAEVKRIETEAEEDAAPEPKPKGADAPAETSNIDPETKDWLADNKWFNNDPALHAYMIKMHQRVLERSPELGTGKVSLDEAKKLVMKKFPEDFGINPRRSAPTAVAAPTGDRLSAGSAVEARFAKIPAEDRAAYERHRKMFKDMGQDYTKSQFLEEYAR